MTTAATIEHNNFGMIEGGKDMMRKLEIDVNYETLNNLKSLIENNREGIDKFKELTEEEQQEYIKKFFMKVVVANFKTGCKEKGISYKFLENRIVVLKNVKILMQGEKFDTQKLKIGEHCRLPYTKKVVVKSPFFYLRNCRLEENKIILQVADSKTFRNIKFYKERIPKDVKRNFTNDEEIAYSLDNEDFEATSDELISKWHIDEINLAPQILRKNFINHLYAAGLSQISGSEAVIEDVVYENANKRYPQFRALKQADKKYLIDCAMTERAKKNINVLARNLFQELHAWNLTKVIEKDGIQYLLKKEYRSDRVVENMLFEKNALIWAEYEYENSFHNKFVTGFNAFDLWQMIAISKKTEDY